MNMNIEMVKKIDDEAFGDLIKLPSLYTKYELSVANAEAYTEQLMKTMNAVDMKKIELDKLEAIVAPIRWLRTKLALTETTIHDGRMPHTRKLDEIASAFIQLEKRANACFQRTVKVDTAFETEKLRRAQVAKDAADLVLKNTQDKIDGIAAIKRTLGDNFSGKVVGIIKRMNDKFYAQASEELTAFVSATAKWAATAKIDLSELYVAADYPNQDWLNEAVNDLKPTFETMYQEYMTDAVSGLTDKVVGRQEQLKTPEVVVVPVDDFTSVVMASVAKINDATETESNREKLNAAFDAGASVAELSVGVRSGTIVKKKYKCDSIEAFQAIMQSWVTHNMPLLSMDELETKLSFMRTAANERLNHGQPVMQAKGLSVVDDIRTRTTKNSPK